MCYALTIPIAIIAIGLLLSWYKGHQNRVRTAALGVTLTGAAALTFFALVPFAYNIISSVPPVWCLICFIPVLVLAFVGTAVALSYHKQTRAGTVKITAHKRLLAFGSAFLLLSFGLFAWIIFVPDGADTFAYHVSIIPVSDGDYIAYLPAPLGGDGDYSEWAKQLKVEKGLAAFSFEDTDMGKTLKVRAGGPVTIGMSAKQAYYGSGERTLDEVHLSLFLNGSSVWRTYRVGLDPVSEIDNVSLNLSMEEGEDWTFDGGGYFRCRGNSTFGTGWHTMVTRYGGVYYD